MIKFTYIAAIIAALCMGAIDSFGGSTKSNPQALAKAATEKLATLSEIKGFLEKLAENGEYTKQFDAAAFANDKKRLVALIRQAGVKSEPVSIDEIKSDKMIYIRIDRVVIIIVW